MILSSKIGLAGLSGVGMGLAATAVEPPLDKLLTSGAAGATLFMAWLFLRYLGERQKEQQEMQKGHADAVKKITEEFSEAVRTISEKHNEAMVNTLRDSREREAQLYNLLREERNKQ